MAKEKLKINYVIYTTIDYTEEKFSRQYNSGQSAASKMEELPKIIKGECTDMSLGWFIRLEGSNESFFISDEEPDLHAGDKVKITLEKLIDV